MLWTKCGRAKRMWTAQWQRVSLANSSCLSYSTYCSVWFFFFFFFGYICNFILTTKLKVESSRRPFSCVAGFIFLSRMGKIIYESLMFLSAMTYLSVSTGPGLSLLKIWNDHLNLVILDFQEYNLNLKGISVIAIEIIKLGTYLI